jgi:UDPglucose 6-dehydrogenase
MVKYAANGFLAAKISFINELSRLCDKLNINVDEVSAGICYDSRIGPSLMKAGIGYGGSCFPKDVSALLATAKQHNCRLSILERVVRVNETQPGYVLDKLIRGLGGLDGKTVAVLGLAFKPNTDDTRESPSLRIVRGLLNRRAKVRVHDPVAKWPQARSKRQPEVCAAAEQALAGADAAILCTDWPEYGRLDWGSIRKTMRTPLFIDGRNMLDAEKMKSLGFRYEGVGIQ